MLFDPFSAPTTVPSVYYDVDIDFQVNIFHRLVNIVCPLFVPIRIAADVNILMGNVSRITTWKLINVLYDDVRITL